jgi:hypothetical protein
VKLSTHSEIVAKKNIDLKNGVDFYQPGMKVKSQQWG